MMRLIISLSLIFILLNPAYAYKLRQGDVLITDFEELPLNRLNGSIGTYGAAEGSGSTSKYAVSGEKSYKLVFEQERTVETEHYVETESIGLKMIETETIASPLMAKLLSWATFVLNMGPIIDTNTTPFTIAPMDFSEFRYLVFWVKGKRSGEDFRIYFRDSSASTYDPQIKIRPKVVVQKKWRPVKVELRKLKNKIDLQNIVQIGIGFGKDDGNKSGNVIYVDNFILIR